MSKQQTNDKPQRIRLIDWLSFWLTLGLVFVLAGAMVGMHLMGWDDGLFGGIASIAIALVSCTLIFDLALLLSAGITVADGMVNAGKDSQGNLMVFHADKVVEIQLRDKIGNILPQDQKKYRRVQLTFVMESGRTNQREVGVLTRKQLQKIKNAIGR